MAMAALAPPFTPFASANRRVSGSPSSSSRRRPKQQRPRQQPSVAEVQRAIGLADDDDPLRMRVNSSSDSPSPSFLDLLSSTPIGKAEGPAERKLREAAEWVVDQTEANALAGQQIMMVMCLKILPMWLFLLLIASGVIKLPFDLPFMDDLISGMKVHLINSKSLRY